VTQLLHPTRWQSFVRWVFWPKQVRDRIDEIRLRRVMRAYSRRLRGWPMHSLTVMKQRLCMRPAPPPTISLLGSVALFFWIATGKGL
jgi:hypothetical protein